MSPQSPSDINQPSAETVIQQSMLQQAEAAAAAQDEPARSTRPEATLQEVDLLASNATEDEIAPPAYGDTYGEIRNDKDGFGTSANVTDDGRVNIRINQLNRRLSQVFTPALRHHVQSVHDSRPPPPPYIPPSLGGEDGTLPPPRLNVVIQVVGSRGDVQPFVALGKVLKNTYGHRVRLATHPNFKDFVQENGLEFFSIGGDPSRLMAFMVKNPGLMPGFRSILSGDVGQRRRDVAEYIQGCWRSCFKSGTGLDDDSYEPRPFVADCIIANPPSFAHIHCAEKLGIPLHVMFTMPYSPTQAFPHPLANIQSNADPQLTNYISYAMIELLSWQGLGDIINRFRVKCLGLDPVSLIWAPGMLERLKVPHTYCWSPALIPKPHDWGSHITIAGFYKLASHDYTPAPELQAFLDAGPPPVYIGFGSIVLDDPNAMTELIFEAVRKTGQRVLLSKGWGGMGADELLARMPNGVFMLGNVPHDWLFEHVSAVVHHGGAGTTAAGITAGRPTVVVPFFGDQLFWGAMVARAGAGPDPIPHKVLTADKLADAINFCLKSDSLERAQELASKIAAERGTDVGAQSFHQFLEVERLRCTLAPSRPAVWSIKRSKVKLSAFAACTLANANLLDFRDLKLFRPQEHYTDEGPWDPLSGMFAAAMRAVNGMAIGLIDTPSETWKAFQSPDGPSRQQSQVSVPTIARTESSNVAERSTLPTSPAQSQTSLNVQGSFARVRSPASFSELSSRTSNVESSCKSSALQAQSHTEEGGASRTRGSHPDHKDSGEDYDMLRPTAPHSSKGLGRFARALAEAPVDLSVGLTKGLHNIPKLWGDETVRRQERVTGFMSGMKAMGREFGFGFYDGLTGLVTQPWHGARKDGASGFAKGMGKGIGGFVTKLSAAQFGILSHTLKGVHKEVQKLFGSNVQNYIITSRTAQGYEEWLQSSDAERQGVIDQWRSIQERRKKRRKHDKVVRSASAPGPDPESAMLAIGGSRPPLRSVGTNFGALDPQRQTSEVLEHEAETKQDNASNSRGLSSGSELESDLGLNDEEDEEFESARRASGILAEKPTAVANASPGIGATQSESDVHRRGQHREKTAPEKTEEEVVMEYVKKQSLLEAHHRKQGKGRAAAKGDEDDEDLERALKASMQDQKNDAMSRHADASGT